MSSVLAGEILPEVAAVVAKVLEVALGTVVRETTLEGLGVDSLAMIEISIDLEERFGFSFPEVASPEELSIVTVGDLADFVSGLLTGPSDARR